MKKPVPARKQYAGNGIMALGAVAFAVVEAVQVGEPSMFGVALVAFTPPAVLVAIDRRKVRRKLRAPMPECTAVLDVPSAGIFPRSAAVVLAAAALASASPSSSEVGTFITIAVAVLLAGTWIAVAPEAWRVRRIEAETGGVVYRDAGKKYGGRHVLVRPVSSADATGTSAQPTADPVPGADLGPYFSDRHVSQ